MSNGWLTLVEGAIKLAGMIRPLQWFAKPPFNTAKAG
jgi:hypothetical protein